jgi:hypothetical protein
MVQRLWPGWRPIRAQTSTRAGLSRHWMLQMRGLTYMNSQGCKRTRALRQQRHSQLICLPGSAQTAPGHQLPDQQGRQPMAAAVQWLRHLHRRLHRRPASQLLAGPPPADRSRQPRWRPLQGRRLCRRPPPAATGASLRQALSWRSYCTQRCTGRCSCRSCGASSRASSG